MVYRSIILRLAIVTLLAVRSTVWSWVPPYPNAPVEFESVHDMRRRLNQPFNYTTSRFFHPESCRYLSETECEEADNMMEEHVRAHQALQAQVRTNPKLGFINVLVLMIRFSDHEDRELIAKEDIELMWSTKMPDWLDVNSQGRYDIKATVINWVRLFSVFSTLRGFVCITVQLTCPSSCHKYR